MGASEGARDGPQALSILCPASSYRPGARQGAKLGPVGRDTTHECCVPTRPATGLPPSPSPGLDPLIPCRQRGEEGDVHRSSHTCVLVRYGGALNPREMHTAGQGHGCRWTESQHRTRRGWRSRGVCLVPGRGTDPGRTDSIWVETKPHESVLWPSGFADTPV